MSKHLSVRIPDELVASIDAMADQRDVERSEMVRTIIVAALQVRQRACPITHTPHVRCGSCGLMPAQTGSALERL